MSIHVIGILALVLVFVIGTWRPVNIGALALIATFFVGTLWADETIDEALAGFPPDLFVLLVGVTYLFGLASVNGTLEWLVERVVGVVGDRPALIPWVIFVFSALPTTAGALGPAGVAMLAPLCLRLGRRYGIDRRLVALMVIHGSCFGNFSPLNGLAIIVQQVAESNGLEIASSTLFLGNAAYNVALAVVVVLLFGGRSRWGGRTQAGAGRSTPTQGLEPVAGDQATVLTERTALRVDQGATMLVMLGVAVGALVYDAEIGFLALIGAVALHVAFPTTFDKAERRIVWSVVLLICGVVTFVAALQRYGTVDVIGESIADLGTPLAAAFLLCLVAAFTSAFGSSAGLLGVLIPLSVPLLQRGDIQASGAILALAISATVVDAMPFSSVGALTLANAEEDDRPALFRVLLVWGFGMVVSAPIVTTAVFIVPSL